MGEQSSGHGPLNTTNKDLTLEFYALTSDQATPNRRTWMGQLSAPHSLDEPFPRKVPHCGQVLVTCPFVGVRIDFSEILTFEAMCRRLLFIVPLCETSAGSLSKGLFNGTFHGCLKSWAGKKQKRLGGSLGTINGFRGGKGTNSTSGLCTLDGETVVGSLSVR